MFPTPQDIVGPWHGWIVHPRGPQRVQVEITYDGLFQGTYSFPDGHEKSGSFMAFLASPVLYIQLTDSRGPLHFHMDILIGKNHTMMYGTIPPAATWPPRVPFATVTMFRGKFPQVTPIAAWQDFFTELT